jgi:hypothetical protein
MVLLIVFSLVRLINRLLGIVELRMILRSLPNEDRVAAAVAYLARRPTGRVNGQVTVPPRS